MDGRGAPQNHARAESREIDNGIAKRAFEMATPLIENAMRDPSFGDSGFLHVVIMKPDAAPGVAAFEEAILEERSYGDRSKWDADYQGFARRKARAAWEQGRDSGDGGVCVDGIVVGASGAFPMFDEAYSGTVAMCLRALAKQRAAR